MNLTCVKNRCSEIENVSVRNRVIASCSSDEVGLRVGQKYPIFGIVFIEEVPWYLICRDVDSEYPVPYCSAFFSTSESEPVKGDWVLCKSSNFPGYSLIPFEWADDSLFFEKLVDGDEISIEKFLSVKQRYLGNASRGSGD